MKKYQLLVSLMFLAVSLFSQGNRPPGPGPGPGTCEELPEQIDSIYYYTWNSGTNVWDPSTVTIRGYEGKNLVTTLELDYTGRLPVSLLEYYYNSSNQREYSLLYRWTNDQKELIRKVEFYYDSEGNKVEEKQYNIQNNDWNFYGYFTFDYENKKQIAYQYFVINSQMVWSQYGDYHLTYTNNLLDQWYAIRVADNVKLWHRYHYYDQNNRLVERIIYQNRLNPVTRVNELLLNIRGTYLYDVYSLNNEVINETWNGEAWVNSGRFIYHRRIDNATRVRICFNGNSQCIPKAQVPNFLSRGATLGACPGTSVTTSTTRTQSTTSSTANLKSFENVKVYPNPATESLTVVAGDNFSRVELLNSNGQTIRSFSLANSDQTIIERNGLPSGVYFLRFVGQDEVKTEKVIFR